MRGRLGRDAACSNGEVGDYVTIARKDRNGADWFLGAITDEQRAHAVGDARLPRCRAQRYRAEIYRDGEGADWKGDARFRFVREQRTFVRGDVLDVWLAGGGGAAVRLVPLAP